MFVSRVGEVTEGAKGDKSVSAEVFAVLDRVLHHLDHHVSLSRDRQSQNDPAGEVAALVVRKLNAVLLQREQVWLL